MHPPVGSVRLSNRQYCQLRAIESAVRETVRIEQVSMYNQLTLGALKRRKLIIETYNKDGVRLTPEGREVLRSFETSNFLRKVSSMRFSSFLHLEPVVPRPWVRRRKVA